MADEKTCTKCGKKLRSDNSSGVCASWNDCKERRFARDGGDVAADEAPPAPKKPRAPKVTEPTEPDWQKQFFQLAEALGLDPMQMLSDFCRGWVEDTRRKALGPKTEAPAGE